MGNVDEPAHPRMGRLVAILLAMMLMAALVALWLLIPLKTTDVVVMEVDKTTGYLQVVRPLVSNDPLTGNEAVTTSNIVRFIKARETYDPKGLRDNFKMENWNLTGAARMALGQDIFMFAPGSEQSHRWNPLDFVRPWPSRATDLSNLAASLIPIPDMETQRIWKETARGLFAAVLGYVLESKTMEGRRNIRSALRLFSTGQKFSAVLTRILGDEPDLMISSPMPSASTWQGMRSNNPPSKAISLPACSPGTTH